MRDRDVIRFMVRKILRGQQDGLEEQPEIVEL